MRRGREGSSILTSQRAQKPHLAEFKRVAFKETKRVFLHVLNLMRTLNDERFGTRAANNQVKILRNIKEDTERKPRKSLLAAFLAFIIGLGFSSRVERQTEAIRR